MEQFIHQEKPIKLSLKTLVDRNENLHIGLEDIQIIRDWFVWNDCEDLGIDLMNDLSKTKLKKVESSLNSIRNWLIILPAITEQKKYVEKYGLDISKNLNKLQNFGLLNKDLASYEKLFNWAKENLPNIDCPATFYIPTLHYLANYNLYFKDKPKEKVAEYKQINYEDLFTREK